MQRLKANAVDAVSAVPIFGSTHFAKATGESRGYQ